MDGNTLITWVLTANATEARCYETQHLSKELKLIKEYFHPENLKKNLDLVTDRPGHYLSRGGVGSSAHGAFVSKHTPKEAEAEHFAHVLAEDINKARAKNEFSKLILIVPSHFHGLLNKHLNTHVLDLVTHHIEKDYTKIPFKKLKEYLIDLNLLK